jgi:hypothetical protein
MLVWYGILLVVLPQIARSTLSYTRTSLRDGSELQRLINQAVSSSAPMVTLPPGSYRFNQSLLVDSARNLAILAAGVEMLFQVLPGNASTPPRSIGVRLIDCNNVSLAGSINQPLVLDYDPPAFWQGTIQTVANSIPNLESELVMMADEGFAPLLSWWAHYRSAATIVAVFFDGQQDRMSLLQPAGVHSWIFNPTNITPAACPSQWHHALAPRANPCATITGWDFDWQRPAVDDVLTIAPLTGYTLNLANSSHVHITDLAMYGASSKGITELDGIGSHHYERVVLGRRPGSNHRLAINSDAFHSAGTQLGPTVRNCTFGWLGDDFFNIHSTMQLVLNGSAGEAFVVEPLLAPAELALYGENSAYGTAVQFENAGPGARLTVHSLPTMTVRQSLTVVGHPSLVVDPEVVAKALGLTAVLTERGLSAAWNFTVKVWRVAVVEDASSLLPGDIIVMDDWSAQAAVVEGNVFHDTYCTPGRLKCPNCRVEGNMFRNAVIHTLQLHALPAFLEGPVLCPNMSLTNNVLENCGRSPVTTVLSWTSNLSVVNNTFL